MFEPSTTELARIPPLGSMGQSMQFESASKGKGFVAYPADISLEASMFRFGMFLKQGESGKLQATFSALVL